ncbi:CLAVATA3/ESR (CLE)-related protein 9 precursor [Zea mays]|jgi:hypothetical protein|uniref:CLE family OsCLE508 protein n=1 Tax=Zea mays TaxID=4577 RepID=A0A1D6M9Q8_MAIZE|nr:CLAVATA3/ESR (CLE)-related protein 9 precursor [Zea mays]AQK87535.1 CLE family OsCLE508 protein [Zea mays]|eukprot:NP_001341492.1 uncharacterized protein LOC100278406 precursor [Zea mays]
MELSWCRGLRLLLVASLLVLSAAALPPSRRVGNQPPAEPFAADALFGRMCDPRGAHPAPPTWCHTVHPRQHVGAAGHRRHHRPVPMPPPGRDGGGEEEIDVRFGVSKRLVPTGPNPLHN